MQVPTSQEQKIKQRASPYFSGTKIKRNTQVPTSQEQKMERNTQVPTSQEQKIKRNAPVPTSQGQKNADKDSEADP